MAFMRIFAALANPLKRLVQVIFCCCLPDDVFLDQSCYSFQIELWRESIKLARAVPMPPDVKSLPSLVSMPSPIEEQVMPLLDASIF